MRTLIGAAFLLVLSSTNLQSVETKPIFEPASLTSGEVAKFDKLFNELTRDNASGPFREKGWPKLELTWKTSSIPVCWENATQSNKWFRSVVRQAVLDSWEAHSRINFSGWQSCVSGNRGVRIFISDQGPHTKGLGTLLDGQKFGMMLNSTYRNWSPSCQKRLVYCSYVIAVHEFGHVLGFAHDQNRPDTPQHCDMEQGSDGSPESISWTPWDEKSVMNYCNPKWSNGGRLSKFDIYLLQRLYGIK